MIIREPIWRCPAEHKGEHGAISLPGRPQMGGELFSPGHSSAFGEGSRIAGPVLGVRPLNFRNCRYEKSAHQEIGKPPPNPTASRIPCWRSISSSEPGQQVRQHRVVDSHGLRRAFGISVQNHHYLVGRSSLISASGSGESRCSIVTRHPLLDHRLAPNTSMGIKS